MLGLIDGKRLFETEKLGLVDTLAEVLKGKLALIDGKTLEDSLVNTEKITLLDTLAEVPIKQTTPASSL